MHTHVRNSSATTYSCYAVDNDRNVQQPIAHVVRLGLSHLVHEMHWAWMIFGCTCPDARLWGACKATWQHVYPALWFGQLQWR